MVAMSYFCRQNLSQISLEKVANSSLPSQILALTSQICLLSLFAKISEFTVFIFIIFSCSKLEFQVMEKLLLLIQRERLNFLFPIHTLISPNYFPVQRLTVPDCPASDILIEVSGCLPMLTFNTSVSELPVFPVSL